MPQITAIIAAMSPLAAEHEKKIPSRRELLILLSIYAVGFTILAINPYDRSDWALESFFPVSMLLATIIVYPHFKFTRLSYYLIFFYLFVQSYGGHYTYALAPPFNWLKDEFHFSRNHYDRLAHFMLGFLMAIPIREILLRYVSTSRRWLAFITASIVLAIGAFYEFIEWWVAVLVTPDLGDKFLGTQGDVWDTHWDMFLALVGAICALAIFMKMHDGQLGAYRQSKKSLH
jgi:putative membrane protein